MNAKNEFYHYFNNCLKYELFFMIYMEIKICMKYIQPTYLQLKRRNF